LHTATTPAHPKPTGIGALKNGNAVGATSQKSAISARHEAAASVISILHDYDLANRCTVAVTSRACGGGLNDLL
jgi:hypothetical protein